MDKIEFSVEREKGQAKYVVLKTCLQYYMACKRVCCISYFSFSMIKDTTI